MRKDEFDRRVNAAYEETRGALSLVWNNLNHGQQQKLLKNEGVAAVLKRYGVVE